MYQKGQVNKQTKTSEVPLWGAPAISPGRSLAKSFHFNLRNKQMLALFPPSENYHNKWILLNKASHHRKFCNKIISHLPVKLPEKQECREYSFLVGSGGSAPRPRSVWKHRLCSLLTPTLSNSYLLATSAANGDNQTLLNSDEAPPVLRSKWGCEIGVQFFWHLQEMCLVSEINEAWKSTKGTWAW